MVVCIICMYVFSAAKYISHILLKDNSLVYSVIVTLTVVCIKIIIGCMVGVS